LYVRGAQDQHKGRGGRHVREADPRTLCLRRCRRPVLPQLSRQHRTDPQCGVQPGGRPRSGRTQPVKWNHFVGDLSGAWQSHSNPLDSGPEGVPKQFVGAPLRVPSSAKVVATLEPILTDYSKGDKHLWWDEGAKMARSCAGQVLSETAGALGLRPCGVSTPRLNLLHRWVETEFRAPPLKAVARATGSNLGCA